jgi:hypothetical protein
MASYRDIMNARLNSAKARQATQQANVVSMQNNQNASATGFVRNGVNPIAAAAMAYKTNTNQPNIMAMRQTQINPQGFTNQNNINGVFGQAMPNTYNRQVGQASPLMQTIDPLTGENIDPTMDQSPSMPIVPPAGVQTPITPVYDINNQQL